MGGKGSGRKPDPVKQFYGEHKVNKNISPNLNLPNLSGVQHEIKSGTHGITTDDLTEGATNLYDQVVSLAEGSNISITGTYPNFTITADDQTTSPAGNDTEIQFNDSGDFGASSDLVWDDTNKKLTLDDVEVFAYGTNNLFFGKSAGNLTLTGNDNFGFGGEVLNSLTDGVENVCIGRLSGGGITGGDGNFLCGYNTGGNITTGNYNTFLGKTVGQGITDTSNNVAIGNQTMAGNADCYNSVAIGGFSGYNNTAWGSVNIGYNTGRNQSSGYYNVCIGYQTDYQGTTGDYNVILGGQAAQGTTGNAHSNNVLIGYMAGFDTNGADNNVLIGYKAAENITTGENNICFGYQVADNLTTGGNNIIIGYNIDASAVDVSNELNIGDLITGSLTSTKYVDVDGYITEDGTFAEIYVADGSTAQTIGTGNTYTKVTAFASDGQSSNCTADSANDKITITRTGRYFITARLNGYIDTANTQFDMALFLDGAIQNNIKAYVEFVGANTDGEMTIAGIIDVDSANEDIDVRVRHDDAGDVDITIVNGNITAQYLGET